MHHSCATYRSCQALCRKQVSCSRKSWAILVQLEGDAIQPWGTAGPGVANKLSYSWSPYGLKGIAGSSNVGILSIDASGALDVFLWDDLQVLPGGYQVGHSWLWWRVSFQRRMDSCRRIPWIYASFSTISCGFQLGRGIRFLDWCHRATPVSRPSPVVVHPSAGASAATAWLSIGASRVGRFGCVASCIQRVASRLHSSFSWLPHRVSRGIGWEQSRKMHLAVSQ